jgi:hypothetical protein
MEGTGAMRFLHISRLLLTNPRPNFNAALFSIRDPAENNQLSLSQAQLL